MKSQIRFVCLFSISLLLFLALISCDESSVAAGSDSVSATPDTVYVHDTISVTKVVNFRDSSGESDSVGIRDSLNVRDSVNILDSINIRDSVHVLDSIVHDTMTVSDTVEVTVHDTVSVHDTLSTGCTMENNEDGSYKVVCDEEIQTLYAALCGGVVYDATSQDCVDDVIIDMCCAKAYDKDKQICDNGIVYDILRDSRDQKAYRTVTIGEQTWMAENLNYSASNASRSVCGGGSTNLPKGDCDTYGRLYTWSAALDLPSEYDTLYAKVSAPQQGICPNGWHLPDSTDWKTLVKTVMEERPTIDFDVQMRSDSLWDYTTTCETLSCDFLKAGENTVGMNILPTGTAYQNSEGSIVYRNDAHITAILLSINEEPSNATKATQVTYMGFHNVVWNNRTYEIPNKGSGAGKAVYQFAVRCIKDSD